MNYRPRFSVRTLFTAVALVGAYLAAWEATKRHTVFLEGKYADYDYARALDEQIVIMKEPAALCALVFCQGETTYARKGVGWRWVQSQKCYYLWLLGPTVKLPVESGWP